MRTTGQRPDLPFSWSRHTLALVFPRGAGAFSREAEPPPRRTSRVQGTNDARTRRLLELRPSGRFAQRRAAEPVARDLRQGDRAAIRRRSHALAGHFRDPLWRGLGRDDRAHDRPNHLLHPDRHAALSEEHALPGRIPVVPAADAKPRPQRPDLPPALCRRRGNRAGTDGLRRRTRDTAPLAMDRLPAALLCGPEIAGGAAMGGRARGERVEDAAPAYRGAGASG